MPAYDCGNPECGECQRAFGPDRSEAISVYEARLAAYSKMKDAPPPDHLDGEGDVEIIERTRVRVECGNCGEPADQRHTYLLPNARSNPQSAGYRGDDITWCSDHEEFTCAACRAAEWRGREPSVEGYKWCSTFTLSKRFAHMFLRWSERKLPTTSAKAA